LQASSSANALVQSLGLNTTPGPFQKAWNQAFTDYSSNIAGHWHKAQTELEQIATKYPQFKAVKPYLDYATTQAKIEKVPQPKPQPTTQSASSISSMLGIMIGVGAVLLAVLLLFGVIVFRRRRVKRTPVSTTPASSFNSSSHSAPPVMQSSSISPSQSVYGQQFNDTLTAFGAPPSPDPRSLGSGQPPAQSFATQSRPTQSSTVSTNSATMPSNASGALVHWPCGHMNRPVARYCSVCGEPAPPSPPARKFEQ